MTVYSACQGRSLLARNSIIQPYGLLIAGKK